MPEMTHHEELSRGKSAITAFASTSVAICGAGALGSNLADILARQGFRRITVIDDDRVEEHNAGTQTYRRSDIGKLKVAALSDYLYDAAGIDLVIQNRRLDSSNAKKFLRDADLVVDCFDNTKARSDVRDACVGLSVPLVHAGLFDGFGQVTWDERYQIPKDVSGDVCDYPLSRNVVSLTVAVLSEVVTDFVVTGRRRSFNVTIKDLKVSEY